MTDNKKRALYEWLDPLKNRKELKDTIRRLEAARKPRDIAYNVVANLQGVGNVNSVTAIKPEFIQTLVNLAPKFNNGGNDVAAVGYHIRKMLRDLEWQHKEREQENERKNESMDQGRNHYIIVVKKDRLGQLEDILNFLDDRDVDYEIVLLSNFDGSADSDEKLLQFEGTAGELYDVFRLIESAFGNDALDDISLTSVQDRITKDALTMSQTIFLLEHE
ncbi:MAG: hypothetical protein ACI37N_11195 [Prevotella sp.]